MDDANTGVGQSHGPNLPRPSGFTDARSLRTAVAELPTTTDKKWRQARGPRTRMEFSGGGIKITATDYARASKAKGLADDRDNKERYAEHERMREDADMLMQEVRTEQRRGTISDFSQKSRARMPWVFSAVDYSALFERGETPCMVTLTYPQEWQRLAPDATTFKQHVNALRKRDWATWGGREAYWAGIWKMEFQRRGAPHLHVGTTVPAGRQRAPLSYDDEKHLKRCAGCLLGAHTGMFEYREWLSRTWTDIIFGDHEQAPAPWSIKGWAKEKTKSVRAGTGVDTKEGRRYADPRRIALYFSKHGLFSEKEYQNNVPDLWRDKPGARFWGYWVVKPVIVSKEMHESLIISIARHLRKLADISSYSRKERHVKGGHNPRTGEIWEPRTRKRPVHRRVKRWRNRLGYGYVVVNDSLSYIRDIGRIIQHFGYLMDAPEPGFLDDPLESESARGARSSGFPPADFEAVA